MIMEVRCCCLPEKLLGHLDVAPGLQRVRYPLLTSYNIHMDFEVIELEVCEFVGDNGIFYKCLKARDIPIETLRKIPGFKEADHGYLP